MKILILAGEYSGDMHAAHLIKQMRNDIVKEDPLAKPQFYGIGGGNMKNAGVHLLYHYKQIELFGFIKVLLRYYTLKKIIQKIVSWIADNRPDLIVFIDCPGFNMRVGALAKQYGCPVLYFIAPKIWASRKSRVIPLREMTSVIAVIFPFEEGLLNSYGCNAVYVGNPLLDNRKIFERKPAIAKKKNITIALLPGSRNQEIILHVPLLNEIVDTLPLRNPDSNFTFILPLDSHLEQIINRKDLHSLIAIKSGNFEEIVAKADLCISASGTATLQVALAGVPQVAYYKLSFLDTIIAKIILTSNFTSLPNLILNKEIIPEFILDRCRSDLIIDYVEKLLTNPQLYAQHINDINEVSNVLARKQGCFANCSQLAIDLLHNSIKT